MAISMARAKTLCSASELAFVKSSTRPEISALSAAKLRQAETRARKLRDKWRDQVAAQRRVADGKGNAAANKNSQAKLALFDEVLGRFTAQLAKVEAAGETPGPMGRRRSTRTARSSSHRASRAETRLQLAEKKRAIKATKKKAAPAKTKSVEAKAGDPPAKKTPKMPAVGKPPVSKSEPAAPSTKRGAKPRKSRRSSQPVAGDATAIVAGREAQGLHITKQQQLLASTTAKQSRLKASGMVRIQTNRSAANRRNQGRRDSR